MKSHSLRVVTVVAVLALLWPTTALARPPVPLEDHSTWDADMINSEAVQPTGAGVYVAILDTGLVPNWRDYLLKERIATHLGTGFYQAVIFKARHDECGVEVEVGQLHRTTFIGSAQSGHGTHVASTIIGYNYRNNDDAAAGYALPALFIDGIASDVTIIPIKVMADYRVPALPHCDPPMPAYTAVFGTSEMLAAGINYATDLAMAGYRPMVINMSLGSDILDEVEQTAIDRALANGVVVVAAAGNEGESGMTYPGAYPEVISVGAVGWTGEWLYPGAGSGYRMWWLQRNDAPMYPGSGDVGDPTSVSDVYVAGFSGRELPGQELDVLAPGADVSGPYSLSSGYSHLPWWSKGIGDLRGNNSGNYYSLNGTSMAAPHVAGVCALLLQVDPDLSSVQVECVLKSTALPMPAIGSRIFHVYDYVTTARWDTNCRGTPCDAVGAGLVQADAAVSYLAP